MDSDHANSPAIEKLRATIARLRGPGGCPWDIEQTHESITHLLIEECAEVIEAIENGDIEHMCEELGDLLLHVVMHAQMASESDHFSFDDIAEGINEKLIRRHPHVFGDAKADTVEEVYQNWQRIKAEEKKDRPKTLFKELPPAIPSLMHAAALVKQINKKGLPLEKAIDPALLEQSFENEAQAGQALFELAARCQKGGIDPESALRRYTNTIKANYEA